MHIHLITTDGKVVDNDYEFDSVEDAVTFFIRTVKMLGRFEINDQLVLDGINSALSVSKSFVVTTTIPLTFYRCSWECEFTNELKAVRN